MPHHDEYTGVTSMANLRTWGLQVLIMAILFSFIFGVIFGNRGLLLITYVVVLSLMLPTVIWFGQCQRHR
jgi:hypothetical protein